MILTYIYHSGFMLEGVSVILIFDFWRDADNSIVERTLSTTHKRVYFLASHFHQDHFNPEILNLPVPHGEKNGRRNGIPETGRKLPRRPHHGTCFRFHRFRRILGCSC